MDETTGVDRWQSGGPFRYNPAILTIDPDELTHEHLSLRFFPLTRAVLRRTP